jgi:oligopeptide/dipeptide ABC transporter ATP-binding protein
MSQQPEIVLQVDDLRAYFGSPEKPVRAVDGVSLTIRAGQTAALVGESGCGKSATALALARLLPQPPAFYAGGRVSLLGRDILALPERELRALRGNQIAYIFQEPASSLNPVIRIGDQIAEALRLHRSDVPVRAETLRLLGLVGVADAAAKLNVYPHELSGGLQQRVMIAMALACRPRLLVADEPTTALDVTIQKQILDLLRDLQGELGMAMLLITHNLGLVAEVAHEVNVMYAGRIVENGPVEQVLRRPRHPYTRALLRAVPRLEGAARDLEGIDGMVPRLSELPAGCSFHPRCPLARARCREEVPSWESTGPEAGARCHFWREAGTTVEAAHA